MTAKYVTRNGLADATGKALPTIDGWIRQGCPYVQRGGKGKEWKFSLPDVIAWRENKVREETAGETIADEAELKRRKLAAETAVAELELAKARGEVAPIREFERAQARAFAEIRANCLNVPQRVVTQLLGCTDEPEFKTKLRAEIVLALQAAAEADLTLEDEEEAEGEE